MDSEETEAGRKRLKSIVSTEKEEMEVGDRTGLEIVEKEEGEAIVAGSEEVELSISNIVDKIELYTQMVSELLESGKTMFKALSNEFEERLITIHKEQVDKWQEDIKELRMLDASNEEAIAVLHNARLVLQNPRSDS